MISKYTVFVGTTKDFRERIFDSGIRHLKSLQSVPGYFPIVEKIILLQNSFNEKTISTFLENNKKFLKNIEVVLLLGDEEYHNDDIPNNCIEEVEHFENCEDELVDENNMSSDDKQSDILANYKYWTHGNSKISFVPKGTIEFSRGLSMVVDDEGIFLCRCSKKICELNCEEYRVLLLSSGGGEFQPQSLSNINGTKYSEASVSTTISRINRKAKFKIFERVKSSIGRGSAYIMLYSVGGVV